MSRSCFLVSCCFAACTSGEPTSSTSQALGPVTSLDAASEPSPTRDASVGGPLGVALEHPVLEARSQDEASTALDEAESQAEARYTTTGWFARVYAAADRKWAGLQVIVAVVTSLAEAIPSSGDLIATTATVVQGPNGWPHEVTIEQPVESCDASEHCWRAGHGFDQQNTLVVVVDPGNGRLRLVKNVADELYGFGTERQDQPGRFWIPGGPPAALGSALGLATTED
jgi:hypothetical protein